MPASSSRRSRKRERTRNEILAAAGRLLAGRDFADLSVAAICEEADVARATFFLHFNYKPSLLLAWEADLVERLDAAFASGGGRAPAVYRAMADVFWYEPGISRSVILRALMERTPRPLLERVSRELQGLAGRGELRRNLAPEFAARAWLGGVAAALSTGEGRRSSERLRDELLGLVLSGVAESKPRLKWAPVAAAGPSAPV